MAPEEPFDEAAADCRAAYRSWRSPVLASALISLAATAPLAAEAYGWTVPVCGPAISELQSIVLLLCLAAVALLCRRVFARGCALLSEKQCSCELLISLAALARETAPQCCFCRPNRRDALCRRQLLGADLCHVGRQPGKQG